MTPDLTADEQVVDEGDDDAPPRVQVGNSGAPVLRLDGYEGPLDLLLELARAQRVDLTRLSIGDLAGQFAAAVEAATAAGCRCTVWAHGW